MGNFVIIGGSSGIGKELVRILSKSGHQVFATYCKNLVEEKIPNVEFRQLNVLDENLSLDFLPEQIDGFVYCPGSINLRPFHRIKAEDFIADYQLQVIGAIRILQEVFPALKISGKASVMLFSSIVVQQGFNFHAQVASSKGALEGLCKSLAAEWAPHIRVNVIAPSLTNTPLTARLLNSEEKKESNAQRHPLQKIGDASDIAEMAAFLLSEKASWITGQIIHIDGGLSSVKL
ncbi:oxidoreductase [Marinifilum breve]|uniref:Oxidoreductase n=1 Tax=Marinifilum breve TaxID=2184082 RepID=A0A2V3ZZ50_9BACT|nr:SDR family oxidoreductase [Marinifilum breve]PXY01606.1 oxidoreductase [Marinifilum breve]